MVAPHRELDHLARADQRIALVVIALVLAVLVAVAMLGVLVGRALRDDPPPVHTYNGTTWVGDTCYVDDQGTLWCQGGSV